MDVENNKKTSKVGEVIIKIVERISKLLDVKSIVTIVLTVVFASLALSGKVSAEQFLSVFTIIIMFFFNYQSNKKEVIKDDKQ